MARKNLTKQQADRALELHFLKELGDPSLRNIVLKKREELEAKTGKPIALLQAWGVIDHTYRPGTPEYKEVMQNLFRITNDQQISRKIEGDRQQARTMDGAGPVQQGSNLTMDDGANEYIRNLDAGNTLPGTQVNGIPSKAPDVNQDEKATFIIQKEGKSESGDLSASLDGEDMVSLNVGSSDDEDYERYEIIDELGRGGMGKVFLAEDKLVGRRVALKEILNEDAAPRTKKRFIEEAKTGGNFVHPNIVPVHDLGSRDGAIYFAMAPVEGEELGDILDKIARDEPFDKKRTYRDAYPLSELLQIFLKICDGVSYAHKNGVIHRDLKPSQVMIGQTGEVYVMDWGLAKKIGDAEDVNKEAVKKTLENMQQQQDTGLTMEGDVVGTPLYMPPEQAKGELDKINETSDIYSLGAILYEILMLTPPVSGESPINVVFNAAQNNIDEMDPDISKELQAITMKALSGNQRKRYRTADGLKQDVMRHINNQKVQAYMYSTYERLAKWVQNHPAKTVGATVGTLALSAILLGAGVAGTVVSSLSAQAKSAEATAAKADSKAAKAEAETAKVEKEKVELKITQDKEQRKAEDEARKITRENRTKSDMLVDRAYDCYKRKLFERATKLYNDSLKIDSTNPRAHHYLGHLLKDLVMSLPEEKRHLKTNPNMKKALEELLKAVELNPKNTNYRNSYAYVLELRGNDEEAKNQYKAAYDASLAGEGGILAILNYATFLARQTKPAEAIEIYKKYLTIAPKDSHARAMLAGQFNDNTQYTEALTHAKQAIDEGYHKANFELGLAEFNIADKRFKEGKVEDARTLFLTAEKHFLLAKKLRPDKIGIITTALNRIKKYK